MSCLIPLIKAGFVDWIVSTGANLYHDTHYALDLPLHQSRPNLDDLALRQNDVIRIYDIVFDYKTLLDTDAFYRELIRDESFARPMGTAEFHHEVGRYLHGRAQELGRPSPSLLAAAFEADVPIYTSSPGDSSIGMNLAALSLQGGRLQIDTLRDVNETAAIVYAAKRDGGKSGVLILGGGSPKNFILQTEPQIQEVLGLSESGHDYFLQITDARPDTGGLSGATASEAMTWGKVDPEKLPDSVTCYTDSTIALPLLTAYALARHAPRPLRRLYDGVPSSTRRSGSRTSRLRRRKQPATHHAMPGDRELDRSILGLLILDRRISRVTPASHSRPGRRPRRTRPAALDGGSDLAAGRAGRLRDRDRLRPGGHRHASPRPSRGSSRPRDGRRSTR